MMPSLDIIIVNWNSGLMLKKCIESLEKEFSNEINITIYVVDNASTDQSISSISNNFTKLNIIKCKENIGFGRACNLAINKSTSDYVLFLNPDTVLYENSVISKCINFLEINTDISVVGVRQVDEKKETLRTCARLYSFRGYFNKVFGLSRLSPNLFKGVEMLEWDHNNSQFVDHVMGSFYMIRRTILEQIGGFNETYFMYLEDLDLSHKVVENGGKIYFNSEISIFHEGGGASKQVKAKRLYYSLYSKYLYFKYNFSAIKFICSLILLLFIEPLIRITISSINLDKKTLNETLKAYQYLFLTLFNKLDPFKIANS